MPKRTKTSRVVYRISFDLVVNQVTDEDGPSPRAIAEANEILIEESVTQVIDEELAIHGDEDGDGTRCGVSVHDAHSFSAKFVEVL